MEIEDCGIGYEINYETPRGSENKLSIAKRKKRLKEIDEFIDNHGYDPGTHTDMKTIREGKVKGYGIERK
jgi:hypothetical protein